MDIDILLMFQSIREAAPEALVLLLAEFSDIVISPAIYTVILGIFWCVDKRSGSFIALNLALCSNINQFIKNTACVYRPWIIDPRLRPDPNVLAGATGYSFPSGHSAQGAGIFGSGAFLVRGSKAIRLLLVFSCLLIGFSRFFLGVHTVWDVLAGLLVGAFSIFATQRLLSRLENTAGSDMIILITGLAAIALYLAFISFKSYPLDYDGAGRLLVDPLDMMNDCYASAGVAFGYLTGMLIERRFIRFSVDGTGRQKLIRFIAGSAAVIAVYFGFKHPLYAALGSLWGHFVLYALLFIFSFVVYPFIFMRIHRAMEHDESRIKE